MVNAFWTLVLLAAPAAGGAAETQLDFDTDVLPLLTKAGCNAAACHGAAAGRGGFKLSLFGADPARDYAEISFALEGRRLDRRHAADSLLLAKPTLQLDHEGGQRLEEETPPVQTILRWIEQGAPRLARRVTALHVSPESTTVDTLPARLALRATADITPADPGASDAARESRDVTATAVYTPVDPSAIEIDEAGHVTVLRPGRHTIVVRYQGLVQTAHITAPLPRPHAASPKPASPDLADPRVTVPSSPLDPLVRENLRSLHLAEAPPADDLTLLRRATLDLTGRLPTPDEVREYLASDAPDRYEQTVERLLQSEAFNDFWTYRFSKLFRIKAPPREPQVAEAFHGWLREQIAQDQGFDQIARQMLLGSGDTHRNGPANFYRMVGDPLAQTEYFSEVFMAVRLRCANCHNHPLDHWTQDDYHGLAAVFAIVEKGREIRFTNRSEIIHPATGEPARHRIPGERYLAPADHAQKNANPQAPLEQLSAWLVAPDNPYFARAQVNRLWQAMMGRGLVEPTDDLRSTNAPSSPELLDALAQDFVEHGYRLRPLLKQIALSQTYRRAVRTAGDHGSDAMLAELEARFFAVASPRPLEAEVLADAIVDVTGVPQAYGDAPEGTRAIQLVDPSQPSETLDILGRCDRESGCEPTAGTEGGGLSARLHLINGPLINDRLRDASGHLGRSLAEGESTEAIVGAFYLRALSRPPRENELHFWLGQINQAPDRAAALEDFVWSLLNCNEFRTNH